MTHRTSPTSAALLALALAAAALPGAASAQASAQASAPGTRTYIVQLREAPAATYSGGTAGLAATRPVQGARLNARSAPVQAYRNHLQSRQLATLAPLGRGVRVLQHYTVALNGYAVQLTDAQARQLRRQAAVASVQPAGVSRLVGYQTPGFLGLTGPQGLWNQLGPQSQPVRGEDVVVGVIDSGIWPENASFGDKVDASGAPRAYHQSGTPAYGSAPAGWAGLCETGPGFTAAMCGGKLIGARHHMAGFLATGAGLSAMDYASPRDGVGHGSHVAATAAGNSGAPALLNGVDAARVSGIAPRARIAAYKACWEAVDPAQSGCYHPDLVQAIEAAVIDGVHVINMSISGSTEVSVEPVDRALLNASAAGVFVAVAAGNAGPYNTVNHVNPWVTTVAASTDDRSYTAELVLGDGARLRGISSYARSLPAAPLALGGALVMAKGSGGEVCRPGSLDPARTAGRIVVCERSDDVTRLDKSAEVKRAGGVGMVLLNTVADNLLPDEHHVPTLHLPHTERARLLAYAGQAQALAALQPPLQAVPSVAPVVARFSSRGPNRSVPSIMKPDIAAPGVNVVAATNDPTLTQAQHDALVLGNFTPPAPAGTYSGTSMASPHVAGVAALLRQLHPTWSPAAIKSALQSSAGALLRADGSPDTDHIGYGAGHLQPTRAAAVPLVYDVAGADYGRFLCGLGLDPGGLGDCAQLGSAAPWDLNLAAVSAGATPERQTLQRSVTNVSGAHGVFTASASLPGWQVTVTPSQLSLAPGARGSFRVEMVATPAALLGRWSVGTLSWSDGVRSIQSPLLAQLSGFRSPALVSDNRRLASGRRVYTVVPGRFALPTLPVSGLQAAQLHNGRVVPAAAQCHDIDVPAGSLVLRVQLFNADTEGGGATDLNLQLVQGSGGVGPVVGQSQGAQSEEAVSILAPAAGSYSACVLAGSVPAAGAGYTLSSWALQPGGNGSLRAQSPFFVSPGSPVSIALAWQAPLGQRYLGGVEYMENGAPLAPLTQVLIDNR